MLVDMPISGSLYAAPRCSPQVWSRVSEKMAIPEAGRWMELVKIEWAERLPHVIGFQTFFHPGSTA